LFTVTTISLNFHFTYSTTDICGFTFSVENATDFAGTPWVATSFTVIEHLVEATRSVLPTADKLSPPRKRSKTVIVAFSSNC